MMNGKSYLQDCLSQVTVGKKVYKGENVGAGILAVLCGEDYIKFLVEIYGDTFEQHFLDFDEYFEKKEEDNKTQYTRKEEKQNLDMRKILELFLDLDAFFCEIAGRKQQTFTIERWENNRKILKELRDVLNEDKSKQQNNGVEYEPDEILKDIINDNLEIEKINDYFFLRKIRDILGERFEGKFSEFIKKQMNLESFLYFLGNEDQEDVQATIGLIERLLQTFGEDEKRLKKHFDIYQIQISSTYYEKMLQGEDPLDLDQVWGKETYPNTDKMKDFFTNDIKKVEQKQNEVISLFNKLSINLSVDTIKLLQDYSIEKKKRERLENNWNYIKNYVNFDELIKLLIKKRDEIAVTMNDEVKKMDFPDVKAYCNLLAK